MEPSGSSTFETSPLVQIHKRDRKSEFFESTLDSGSPSKSQSPLLKKRKFKIVPNETENVSKVGAGTSTILNQMPDDRKDILKLVSEWFVSYFCVFNGD